MAKKGSYSEKSNGVTINSDKKAALDGALAMIEKQFGVGAIMKLGDKGGMNVETTSSGSISLDNALGGGYAKGRVVEIYGPESSGKCLTADTYILTAEGGYKTIGEIFNDSGLIPSSTTKKTEKRYELVNRYSEAEYTTHFTHNGKKPTKTITTKTGVEICATHNHPLLTISKRGYLVWKNTSEIEAGDYLVNLRDTKHFGKTSLSDNEAYSLGIIIADGCISSSNRISITNDDTDIKNFINNSLGCSIGFIKSPKCYPNNRKNPISKSIDHHFNDGLAKMSFMNKYELNECVSKDKIVPKLIMSGDLETVKNFLKGYFDCESYLGVSKGELSVVSASKKLIGQIKLLLSQFGIISIIRKKYVKNYPNNDYYNLSINGLDISKFIDTIGTNSKLRLDKFNLIKKDKQLQTNIDSIPNMSLVIKDMIDGCSDSSRLEWKLVSDYIGENPKAKLTYDRLNKILSVVNGRGGEPEKLLKTYSQSNYFFDEVVSCENSGEKPTFDFAMEKTHSFIANGAVSHNTTLTLHAIAEAQKSGGVAAFIDAEHALDPVYAKKLGVDTENLIISQPDYGEQALEIVDALVRSGAVDLIVIDSVAALTPKAEIEGSMGDSFMGLQARLMSQALRKITGSISKSNTTVIFINQIRMKIGVMFGSPETTSGGNALKFYASQRLDIRKKEKLDLGTGDSKEAIGTRVKIKVVKNKVAPPFREVELDVMFNEGISYEGDLLDVATNKEIVKKSGSFYSFEDVKLGQGRDNSKKFLKENKDVAKKIDKLIRDKK